jgi:hypothetical protein
MHYSLDDYSRLLFAGINYKLPIEVDSVIKKLTIDLGINVQSSTVSTQGTYKAHTPMNRKRNIRQQDTSDVWEKAKPFKATTIEKKEGIEKIVNEIRSCLNKASYKNFEKQKATLLSYFEPGSEAFADCTDDMKEEAIRKMATSIIDIACTNRIQSELYALLYKELADKFPEFIAVLNEHIESYKADLLQLRQLSSSASFDEVSNHNKANDRRKDMGVFIVNVSKLNIIRIETVFVIINTIMDLVQSDLDVAGNTSRIDDLADTVFVIATTMLVRIDKTDENNKWSKLFTSESDYKWVESLVSTDLTTNETWLLLLSKFKELSKMKVKEHASLSSRCVFKFLEMVEFIQKNS